MIGKAALAATMASGLVYPSSPVAVQSKPAMEKAESFDFAGNMLLGMPITIGILASSNASFPIPTYITNVSSGVSSQSSYTFGSVSIGTASSDRLVVVVASLHNGTSNTLNPVVAATIGGSPATIHVTGGESEGAGGNSTSFGIFSCLVTAGTTATIVVDCSGTAGSCVIHVYTLTGYRNATPTSYSATNGSVLNLALGSFPTGVAIGGAVAFDSSSLTYSSTGTVQPTSDGVRTVGSRIRSGFNLTNASGSPTLSCAFGGSNNDECFYACVWQ